MKANLLNTRQAKPSEGKPSNNWLSKLFVLATLLFMVLALSSTKVVHGATIIVNGSNCTLVAAITNANNDDQSGSTNCTAGNGHDMIQLPSGETITLTTANETEDGTDPDGYGPVGLPPITSPITIEGNGATITRSSSDNFRLFYVKSGAQLTLQNLTLSNGFAQGGNGNDGNGGGGGGMGAGGAIFNQGILTINGVTFSGNMAQGGNGGAVSGSFMSSGGNGGGMGGDRSGGLGGPFSTSCGSNVDGHFGGFGGGGGGGGYIYDYINQCGGSGDGGDGGFGGGGGGGGYGSSYGDGGFGGGNGGGGGGGGLGAGGAIFNNAGTINITNSTFSGNAAQGGNGTNSDSGTDGDGGSGFGGALFNNNGIVTLNDVTFANNSVSSGTGNNDGNAAGHDISHYPPRGTVSGQVTGSDSSGLGGILVIAYRFNEEMWDNYGSTTTDAYGHYSLNLPEGSYRIYFVDHSQQYRNEYYDDATTFNDATEITVEADQTTENINAVLAAFPAPQIEVDGGASTSVDPETGMVIIRGSPSQSNEVTIRSVITCDDESVPTDVTLVVGSNSFPMTAGEDNQYSATLTVPDELPNNSGPFEISIRYECDAPVEVEVGRFELFDPSGQITDGENNPISGAIVNLYRVPDAEPDQDGEANDCRTTETRPGGPTGDWSGVPAATLDDGIWVNPDLFTINASQEISPTINPQITGSDGRYAWDVAEGCWYVVVEAEGYSTTVSPLVGVPPEVTDLDIVLSSDNSGTLYLPLVVRGN